MASTPEKKVKDAVKRWLNARGAWWYMVVPNGYSRAGVPDFIACLNGRMLAIETKAPGKRRNTTPNQKRELAAVQRAGGISLVIDDVSQLDGIDALCPPAGDMSENQPQAQSDRTEAARP